MRKLAQYPSLVDRAVLVTGGGSGIGAAIVEEFAHQGAKVALVDVNLEASNALVERLASGCRHKPHFIPCDLKDIEALREAVREISGIVGPPEVLVNNAGSDDRHDFQEVTVEYWDNRIAVNLRHQFFASQAVAEGMKLIGRGSIINMGSIAWKIPTANVSVYATSKAAILGLTRSLAHHLGPFNIRVNCISPGAILTERQQRLWRTPEYENEVLSRQMLKVLLEPSAVARLAVFLAADDSDGITSQNHIVDAGWI